MLQKPSGGLACIIEKDTVTVEILLKIHIDYVGRPTYLIPREIEKLLPIVLSTVCQPSSIIRYTIDKVEKYRSYGTGCC